jgi:hypothetical protein
MTILLTKNLFLIRARRLYCWSIENNHHQRPVVSSITWLLWGKSEYWHIGKGVNGARVLPPKNDRVTIVIPGYFCTHQLQVIRYWICMHALMIDAFALHWKIWYLMSHFTDKKLDYVFWQIYIMIEHFMQTLPSFKWFLLYVDENCELTIST